jgi:hypothetical protein
MLKGEISKKPAVALYLSVVSFASIDSQFDINMLRFASIFDLLNINMLTSLRNNFFY